MFGKNQDDRIREWNKLIERYISLHKYVKEVGKIGITHGRSGHINSEVQTKIKEALTQTDKALNQIKNFFRPCLTEVDISDIFPEEKSKLEFDNLNKKITDLAKENHSLQQKLSENPEHTKSLEFEDKTLLHMQIAQLKRHCKFLNDQIQEVISKKISEGDEAKVVDTLQFVYRKRQEELEETLKVQNDLIYELKHQLASTIRERENFKILNKDLEIEFRKQGHFQFNYESKSDEDIQSKLATDYSNRSTMRVEEYTTLRNEKQDILDKELKTFPEYQRLNEELMNLKITTVEQTEKLKAYVNDTQKENDEKNVNHVEKSNDDNENQSYDKLSKEEDKSLQDNKHENEPQTLLLI